jgi:hypothetical protein
MDLNEQALMIAMKAEVKINFELDGLNKDFIELTSWMLLICSAIALIA